MDAKTNCPNGANGEMARAAERFALVGTANELAIVLGVLPWPTGEAKAAAATCFKAWLDNRAAGVGAAETWVRLR